MVFAQNNSSKIQSMCLDTIVLIGRFSGCACFFEKKLGCKCGLESSCFTGPSFPAMTSSSSFNPSHTLEGDFFDCSGEQWLILQLWTAPLTNTRLAHRQVAMTLNTHSQLIRGPTDCISLSTDNKALETDTDTQSLFAIFERTFSRLVLLRAIC